METQHDDIQSTELSDILSQASWSRQRTRAELAHFVMSRHSALESVDLGLV